MAEVIIGIGGNLGDRLSNLLKGGGFLAQKIGNITAFSPVIESEPWGFDSDNKFLNQILIFETELSPIDILKVCLETEQKFGRQRSTCYIDRVIDIDILFYNDDIIKEDVLTVPHPRIQDRLFILKPLEQIRPGLIHPVSGKSVIEMLAECPDKSATSWLKEGYSTVLLP